MAKQTKKADDTSSAVSTSSSEKIRPDASGAETGTVGEAPSVSPHHSLFSRILAIGGIAVILILYIATLFFAIFDRSETMNMFLASVVCTIVVPVLLYVYNWIYRLLKKDREDKEEQLKKEMDKEN